MKKVLLITEYLNPPYDEGIKKTVYNLFLDLDKKNKLRVICRFGFKKENIHIVKTNPLFISIEVIQLIKNFNPDSLIYFPFQSSTFASYLRLKIFSIFSKTNEILFIALQPKSLKKWQESIVKHLKSKYALTPSPSLHKFWNKTGRNNELLPLLTDLSIFKPINNPSSKHSLRKKHNLPIEAFIISHMGHLNEGRNLESLIPIQESGFQVVIAISSSTPKDAKENTHLKEDLLDAGIIILDGYIESIEEIYQLSDVYIFPVLKENSSIGMPLSILEARACALPVVTTDYGSIKIYMADDFEGIKYAKQDNFIKCLNEIKKSQQKIYTNTKVPKLNKMFYEIVHKKILN